MSPVTVRKKSPPPLDRGWAWMIVLGVFINVFFMVGIAKSYGLFLLAFRSHFEVTTAYAALPMSMTAFVYALGAPTAILVAELITSRRVVIIGATTALIGISLCSLLVSMWYIVLLYGFCVGIGNSCFYGNGLVMLGKYFRKWKSLATGLGLAGASIGQFVMPPVIEYLLETYGLGGTLLIIAALYSHCAISGALFRPIEQYGPEEKKVKIVTGNEEEGPEHKEDKKSLVKTTPGHIEMQVEVTLTDSGTSTSSPDNGVTAHPATNGNVNDKDNHVSFEDLKSKDTSDLIEDAGSLSELSENTRWSKSYGENLDDEDKCFLERKALLVSTGSIFLVSQSVLDVSEIDSRAHRVDTSPNKTKVSCIRRIFDFSILKSYVTIFFTLVSFLCFFGYFNLILFLPAITEEKGITKYDKALLISICGAGDLIARIGTGFFADLDLFPRYQLKATACLLSGINIFVFIYADTFPWIAFHCFCYGFLGGTYVCLMSVVLVDFVGVELLAKNLAVVLLIQGVGAAVGQTFLGWVRDQTGNFDCVIVLLCLNLVAGGVLLFFYKFVRRWEDARLNRLSKD